MVFIPVCVDGKKETLPQDLPHASAREGLASAGLNFHVASAAPFRNGCFTEFAGLASASAGSSLEEAVYLGKPRVQLQSPTKDASLQKGTTLEPAILPEWPLGYLRHDIS